MRVIEAGAGFRFSPSKLETGIHLQDVGCRIDAAGIVRLRGRRKDEINRAGMKVQPAEIDMLLERHPDVAEACCFGIPDDILGEKVGAAIRALPDRAVDFDALRQWCRTRLHAAAVPERWFAVADIPKTERGKIRRDDVMRHCLAQGSAKPAVAP